MTLLTLSVQGQETVTKSGTVVRPADRMPASFTKQTKSFPTLSDPTAGTYLVVTRPDLQEPLLPFIRWKKQQGYRVEVLCTTTNQRDSIRAQLTERYANATALLPAQRYVLIVGDVDRIQAFAGRHTPSGLTNRATDLYYGEYTGDYLPEAYVGRLSVSDSAELAAVVTKIITYEQGLWVTTAQQLMFAAGSELSGTISLLQSRTGYGVFPQSHLRQSDRQHTTSIEPKQRIGELYGPLYRQWVGKTVHYVQLN